MNHENVIFLKEYFEEGNKVRSPLGSSSQAPALPQPSGGGDRSTLRVFWCAMGLLVRYEDWVKTKFRSATSRVCV